MQSFNNAEVRLGDEVVDNKHADFFNTYVLSVEANWKNTPQVLEPQRKPENRTWNHLEPPGTRTLQR